jgi:hypothetical protein
LRAGAAFSVVVGAGVEQLVVSMTVIASSSRPYRMTSTV